MEITDMSRRGALAGCVLAVAAASGIGCDTGGQETQPVLDCTDVGGIWDVAIDYGNGLVQRQTWAITQNVCELTLTGDPPDVYGPSLDATPQHGFAREGFFHASWQKVARNCLYTTVVEPSVDGGAFSGDMLVTWRAEGGECSSGSTELPVTGIRQ